MAQISARSLRWWVLCRPVGVGGWFYGAVEPEGATQTTRTGTRFGLGEPLLVDLVAPVRINHDVAVAVPRLGLHDPDPLVPGMHARDRDLSFASVYLSQLASEHSRFHAFTEHAHPLEQLLRSPPSYTSKPHHVVFLPLPERGYPQRKHLFAAHVKSIRPAAGPQGQMDGPSRTSRASSKPYNRYPEVRVVACRNLIAENERAQMGAADGSAGSHT